MMTLHKMVCIYGFNNLSLEKSSPILSLNNLSSLFMGKENKMQILNFSQARACFKEVMEDVCRDHEPTVITRQRGNPVVVMSLDDFNGMKETIYL